MRDEGDEREKEAEETAHDDPSALLDKLKAAFRMRAEELYNQGKPTDAGSLDDRFKLLRLTFYYQRLFGNFEDLKQFKAEIASLTGGVDASNLLNLKLLSLKYQASLLKNGHQAARAWALKEVFLEQLGFGQNEAASIYMRGVPEQEQPALKRLTAKIYRKFGDEKLECQTKDSSHKESYYNALYPLGSHRNPPVALIL